jgi:hypothetical protein
MAAGLATSIAQSNVYSANVVGYVNVTNAANQYAMLANPLDNGTNDLTSLLASAPNGAQALVFQGGVLQQSSKTKGVWSQNFIIPPGTGFFLKSPANGTNTFVGNVAGPSNNIVAPGNVTVLVGSPIPFSGTLSDQGTNTMNLNVLPNGSIIYMLINGSLQQSSKTKGVWTQNFSVAPGQGFYLKSSSDTNVVQFLQLQ